MAADEINYKTLRKIQQMESSSPMLTKIDHNFYSDLSSYLKYLDRRLEKESSSQKHGLLEEEIRNTKKIAASIYEQREKKMLLAAVSKARGGNPDLKHLVDVERNLFNAVLKLMVQSRKQLLDKGSKKEKRNEEVKTVESKKGDQGSEEQNNSNPIVRVTQDVPEFVGIDMKKYNLRKGDVLSLHSDMSAMLSKRDVVKEIKQQ